MTTTRSPLALAAGLLLAASAAHAQTAPAPTTLQQAVKPPTSMPQVDAAFVAWDTNHNGALSLDEFRAGASGVRTSMVDRRLHAQFAAVDTDKNGGIDAGEYARLPLVKRAGPSAPPLSAFDANHDQRLNYAEYTDLVRRLAAMPAARAAAPGRAPGPVAPAPAAPVPVRK